jgi:Prp8 binding protein
MQTVASNSTALVPMPERPVYIAPLMILSGHSAEVLRVRFSPSGGLLASASMDRSVFLWDMHSPQCTNVCVLRGHRAGVLDAQWLADGQHIATCSADKTLRLWDATAAQSVRAFRGHTGIVNAVAVDGRSGLLSASDDGSAALWDSRSRHVAWRTDSGAVPLTAAALASPAGQPLALIGGIDNGIHVYCVRTRRLLHLLRGHTDTITSLAATADGSTLLSNGMDASVRVWDLMPHSGCRLRHSLLGASHSFERYLLGVAWHPSEEYAVCPSADRSVVVWDAQTGREAARYPGHAGTVIHAEFHPKFPLLASCGADKMVLLGEALIKFSE